MFCECDLRRLSREWQRTAEVALPAAPVRPRPVPLREPIRVEQPELQPETKPEPLPEKKAPAAPADIIKKLPLLPPKPGGGRRCVSVRQRL